AIAAALDAVERARRERLPSLAACALDVVREASEQRAADTAAEPRRGGLLEPVRLVEHDGVVLGQDSAAGCDVGEVEGVVHDHEVGLGRARTRALGEAAAVERAAAARTAVCAD